MFYELLGIPYILYNSSFHLENIFYYIYDISISTILVVVRLMIVLCQKKS